MPDHLRAFRLAVLALAAFAISACRSGPCPADTELQGSPRSGQQLCAYQDSNGRVVRHGPFTEWHANGQKSIEGRYEHGKQVGRWTYWDEAGRKTGERQYRDGVITAEIKP